MYRRSCDIFICSHNIPILKAIGTFRGGAREQSNKHVTILYKNGCCEHKHECCQELLYTW